MNRASANKDKGHSVARLNRELADLLRTSTRGVFTLDEASQKLTVALGSFKTAKSLERLGFVAGIRESDGPENVKRNSERLAGYTDVLRRSTPFPLFSCIDIYDRNFLTRFDGVDSSNEWDRFWRRIFEPKIITDLYLTPRWNVSYGTKHEWGLAREFDIQVHFAGQDPLLRRILKTIKTPMPSG